MIFQWFFLRRAGQCVLVWVIPCTLFAPFCSTHWKLNKLKIFVELRLLDPCTSVLAKGSVPYLGRFASLATFLAPQHHLPFCPQYHTPYTHTQKHIPGTRKKTPYRVDTLTKNQNDNGDMFRKIVQDWIKQVIQISTLNFTLCQILTLVDSWSIR